MKNKSRKRIYKETNGKQWKKTFGKWKQDRLTDGVKYPVITYNLKDLEK